MGCGEPVATRGAISAAVRIALAIDALT